MTATGILRRIDDLGRVVIPREIRRRLGLKEGDALEIFIDHGGVCFVPIQETMIDEINQLGERVSNTYFEHDQHAKEETKRLLNALIEMVKES